MSRISFGNKPFSYPQPVLIIAAYDEEGQANAMNAAWGGISNDDEISICLSPDHKTVKNLLGRKAFTVSMGDAAHVAACDYLGLVSGNKESRKLEKAGLTVTRSALVDAPIINELAVCLECELISYDPESCRLDGRIINVSVEEEATTDGRVDPAKVAPICFDPFNMSYHVLGEKVGRAFRDGRSLI